MYIMFLVQFTSVVGFSSIFPFLPLYVQELGTNTNFSIEFLSGMVFSAQAMTMMVASPFWGAVADRYGRKLMVQRATFAGAILVAWMGFVSTAEMLVLVRAIQGAFTGVISAANALVASAAPRERTGYAMGVLQVGLTSGLAFGPLIGGAMADWFGYRPTFLFTGALLFVAGLTVSFAVEEEFTPIQPEAGQKNTMFANWLNILRSPGVKLTYAVSFMANLARLMIIPIAPLFILTLLDEGASVNTFTGLVIGVSAAASTLTAIYLGRLGDRIGHRQILWAGALCSALFFIPQAFVTAGWQLLLLQALAGAAYGGVTPSLAALLAQYTRRGAEGSVFGLNNSIRAASRSVAPLLGAGIATWFGLRATFLATGVTFVIVMLMVLFFLPKTTRPSPMAASTISNSPEERLSE